MNDKNIPFQTIDWTNVEKTDDLSSHRSITKNGVKLMIIDGDFLKLKDSK